VYLLTPAAGPESRNRADVLEGFDNKTDIQRV